MRSIHRMVGLALLIALTGCESTRWNWMKHDTPAEVPTKPGAVASTAAYVTYLNDNANRVSSLKVDDLSIDASIDHQTFGLGGRILAEKPLNFRMKATVLGKDEVDIGSNQQEFWFWAAKNPEPRQYFCSYRDLNEGRVRMMPLPIQPQWVMESMGLGPYGPADRYQIEYDKKSVRLIENAKSPQGTPVRKVIVMNPQAVKAPRPQVTDYLLLDDRGQEICSAHIIETKVYPGLKANEGVILPYKMELRMPMQKMKLVLRMDGVTVNGVVAATAFVRQPMAGVEQLNLATGQREPWGLQRTQGIGPSSQLGR